MAAARAQHVVEVVEPALAAGRDVVTDRFVGLVARLPGLRAGARRSTSVRAAVGLRHRWPVARPGRAARRARRGGGGRGPTVRPTAWRRRARSSTSGSSTGFRALAAAEPDRWRRGRRDGRPSDEVEPSGCWRAWPRRRRVAWASIDVATSSTPVVGQDRAPWPSCGRRPPLAGARLPAGRARRGRASGPPPPAFAAALLLPRRRRRRRAGDCRLVLAGEHPDVHRRRAAGRLPQRRRRRAGDRPAGRRAARSRGAARCWCSPSSTWSQTAGAGAAQDHRGAAGQHGVRDPRRRRCRPSSSPSPPAACRIDFARRPDRRPRRRAGGRGRGRRRRAAAAAEAAPGDLDRARLLARRPRLRGRRRAPGAACRTASTAPARRSPSSSTSCSAWSTGPPTPLKAGQAEEVAELERAGRRLRRAGRRAQGAGRPPAAGAAPAPDRRAALRAGHAGRRATGTSWPAGGPTPARRPWPRVDATVRGRRGPVHNPNETLLLQALLLRLPERAGSYLHAPPG